MNIAGLALAIVLSVSRADTRYTALELSALPKVILSHSSGDDNPVITHHLRLLLANCLKRPGERGACIGASARYCPQDTQVYVCANSEYIVWTDYIDYFLSILRKQHSSSYAPLLERSQAAWRTYAAAQCDYIAQLWLDIDPRMRSMQFAECKRDEAGRRALSMRADILNLATND